MDVHPLEQTGESYVTYWLLIHAFWQWQQATHCNKTRSISLLCREFRIKNLKSNEDSNLISMFRSEENRRMDFGRRRMSSRFSTRCFLCRTEELRTYLFTFMIFYLLICTEGSYSKTCDKNCIFGRCINGTCVCDQGWAGDQCQHCQGKFKWVTLYPLGNRFIVCKQRLHVAIAVHSLLG